MKQIYNFILIFCTLFFFACQQEEGLSGGATGYLRLNVNEDAGTNSRVVPDDYKPKQIAVQIVNEAGTVVEETEDWELWDGQQIPLEAGTYTIKASSNGFDGQDVGWDIPYYAGSKEVTIAAGEEVNETITCTQANVKVTANVSDSLLNKVRSVAVQVRATNGNYTPMNFTSTETRAAYFPVTGLTAEVTVINNAGVSHTMSQELGSTERPVQARDHYILNIKLAEVSSGSNNITVTVDPTTHEYSYTFSVSTVPTASATMTAGAWDRLAYLKATNVDAGTGESVDGLKFQYRTATVTLAEGDEDLWKDVVTTAEEDTYTAMLTGLTASTTYEYRVVNGEGTQIGSAQSFTTGEADAQTALQNGGFEDWCTIQTQGLIGKVNTAYPNASADVNFWDTSNTGANTMSTNDPTSSVTSPIVSGTHAAKLESKKVVIAFAAASLYTGTFGTVQMSSMSATLNFGQPFTSRPIALHGYYQYSPKNVDNVGDNLPADATVSEGNPDECSIYIAMAKKAYEIDNSKPDTFIDFENDDNIIAYGTIEGDYVKTNGAANGYTEFTIPLQYKESQFGAIPTHIIIVCSASKYGDYMTGGEGSTLYVDDFSLVYEGTPSIWKNK
ncbi:MAG TPA: PCMD domain-containing protein [Candidatus Phocaeicola caecigallinarum]|nr:PCMD domain-containing protein [Candidatus Phocaeicola caecigallinarum]